MPQLKLYTDKHIPRAVAVQLRLKNIDIVRCEDVGMGDAKDMDHLEYASKEGRALISQDTDFQQLHHEWQQAKKHHGGIFLVPGYLQGNAIISVVVKAMLAYDELIAGGAGSVDEDIANRLHYLIP
jgi:predicted nuclease of predicted toxin-antitoxin system